MTGVTEEFDAAPSARARVLRRVRGHSPCGWLQHGPGRRCPSNQHHRTGSHAWIVHRMRFRLRTHRSQPASHCPSRRVLLALSYPAASLNVALTLDDHGRIGAPTGPSRTPCAPSHSAPGAAHGSPSCRQAPSHRRSTSRSRWRRSPGSSGRRLVPHQGATTALPGRHPASQFDDIDKTELCQRCRGDGAHSPGAAVDRQGRVPLGG